MSLILFAKKSNGWIERNLNAIIAGVGAYMCSLLPLLCYNAQSIADKKEYGSAIYQVKKNAVTFYSISVTYRFLGFSWSAPLIFPIINTIYYYSYTKPSIGKDGDSVFPNLLTLNPIVSTVHTHGNYDAQYDNENFSTGFASDIGWSNFFRMNSYVATP